MRLVIIESPYAGDRALNERYLRYCILDCLSRDESPYASHRMLTDALDDNVPEQRELGIKAGLEWGRAFVMVSPIRTNVAEAIGKTMPSSPSLSAVIDVTAHVFYTDLGWGRGMLSAREFCEKTGRPIEERRLPSTSGFFDSSPSPRDQASFIREARHAFAGYTALTATAFTRARQAVYRLCNAIETLARSETQTGESLETQVARLAAFILDNIPGEPYQNQGAIDTAIRLLRRDRWVAYLGGPELTAAPPVAPWTPPLSADADQPLPKPTPRMYADRDAMALEPHYSRHVGAMTREGLHGKGDIAAELAFRDARIAEWTRLAQAVVDGNRGLSDSGRLIAPAPYAALAAHLKT